MKALTVQQGWASMMFQSQYAKDVENRTWETKHRGDLLIHAGSSKKSIELARAWCLTQHLWASYGDVPLGAIIGVVEVVGCGVSASRWAMPNHYHWLLASPRQFKEPIACKGKLSLWVPDDEVMKKVQIEMERFDRV